MDATSLAEYLVVKGIPFRTAHQIVGSLVRLCEETGRTKLAELKVEEINAAIAQAWEGPRPRGPSEQAASVTTGDRKGAVPAESPATPASIVVDVDVYSCLGARNVVARYQSAGAAGGEPLKKQLAEWKQRLGI
jgi:argininosuccinate lyase